MFQLTTTDNDMKNFNGYSSMNNGLLIVDLGVCGMKLANYYGLG